MKLNGVENSSSSLPIEIIQEMSFSSWKMSTEVFAEMSKRGIPSTSSEKKGGSRRRRKIENRFWNETENNVYELKWKQF